jgi:alanine racemase
MDMIMVDVTHIACNEGDEVIVFNTQEMIQHIADISETIVYETLTAISPRVHKILTA